MACALRFSLALALLTTPLLAGPGVGYGRGQIHPDFHLPKLDKTMGHLSEFRGKKVFLFNFASW